MNILSISSGLGYSAGFALDSTLNEWPVDLFAVVDDFNGNYIAPMAFIRGKLEALDKMPGYLGTFRSSDGLTRELLERQAKAKST